MKMIHNFLKAEHGQTLLESALSLAVLLTMLFGCIAGGLMLYTYHYLSYAARIGNRYAIVRGSSCDASNGMPDCPNVTSSQVQTYVRSLHYGGFDPNQLTITVTWPSSTGGTIANAPGDPVQVRASYPFPLSIPFVPSSVVNMHSTSQMTISQ